MSPNISTLQSSPSVSRPKASPGTSSPPPRPNCVSAPVLHHRSAGLIPYPVNLFNLVNPVKKPTFLNQPAPNRPQSRRHKPSCRSCLNSITLTPWTQNPQ